jgi:hypothetical protein
VLCTALSDAYKDGERREVHDALEILLSPSQPDWSPKGVYAYWDYETHDLLYLGLASDLRSRFAQHNGLVRHGGGNKQKEIDAYFATKERLGLTVLLQSKAVAIWEEVAAIDFTLGGTASEIIAVGEGQLIEMHRLVHGARPPWNKTGGSRDGKRWAEKAPALLDILAARRDSLFVARRTLREVAWNIKWRFYEATIHAARIRAVMDAHGVMGIPPGIASGDSEAAIHFIQQSMMLREGHIVQELDESDEVIRRWLELLGDPEHWERERADHRALLEEMTSGTPLDARSRELADYLDSVIDQAAPPSHILATRDILETGYLDDQLQLP